jgi:hypothetical protein
MEKEEVEKTRQLQEERDVSDRPRKEQEARREMERKQAQVWIQEQHAQQKKHNEAFMEMRERLDREREQLTQKMMDEHREAHAALPYQEDMRPQAEKTGELQKQIAQLVMQPPLQSALYCLSGWTFRLAARKPAFFFALRKQKLLLELGWSFSLLTALE